MESPRAGENQGRNNEYWRIPRLGILISRKIELLALAAFVIALVTLFLQVKGCLQGPKVQMFPPDQIFIIKDTKYTDGKARVRFGANMLYVNDAQKGYSGIVTGELIRFAIGKKNYEHSWDQFVEFCGGVEDMTIENTRSAKPVTVEGGNTESHHTYFIAWPKRGVNQLGVAYDVLENHAYWDEFIKDLKQRVKNGEKEYAFYFEATIHGKPSCSTTCKISIDEKIVGAIELYGKYCPTCYSEE